MGNKPLYKLKGRLLRPFLLFVPVSFCAAISLCFVPLVAFFGDLFVPIFTRLAAVEFFDLL